MDERLYNSNRERKVEHEVDESASRTLRFSIYEKMLMTKNSFSGILKAISSTEKLQEIAKVTD